MWVWMWATLWCAAVVAGADKTAGCDLIIGGDTYRKETLVSDINMEYPFGLAVDYASNLLYFSFKKNRVWFSAKLDLDTKAVNTIDELTGWCSFAVDQVLQEVHAGCGIDGEVNTRGLFQFDSNIGHFMPTGEEGKSVHFVYYKDMLYYSVEPSLRLQTFSWNHSEHVQGLSSHIYRLVIDKNKDWVFYNEFGMYRRRANGETKAYKGVRSARALAVDANGDAYGCDFEADGDVYRLPDWTSNKIKLLNVTSCTGLTFDGDNNMIYAEYRHGITRLVKC